tara:strand:+ start:205 stop:633 length:429 start_codon:yes stop_codon:yes gene_type:complete
MAKAYTGRDGSLRLSDVDQVKVIDWSLSASLETLETTALSDKVRSYTPGIQSFSGSATLLYYKQDDGSNDASALLRNLVRTNTSTTDPSTVTLTLRLADGSSYSDVKFNAYLTSVEISARPGDTVKTRISFQVTDGLSEATF